MNCEQFQFELERAIDERQLSDHGPVSDHADACESCRLAWQDFLLLESALASWTEPVKVDLVDRVVEAARSAPSPPKDEWTANRRRNLLTVATVAAILLGAAFVFRPGPDQTADNDSPVPTLDHSPFEPDLNKDDQYAGVDELLASTRSAWEGIASKAANQASGLSVFVPDLNSDLGLPGPDVPIEPDEPSPKESSEEESIIPGEINRAFDFFLDVSEVTTT